ncbi:CoA ester lyase [Pseudoclavibacter sp. RFBJ3]|uniref:HpcH/HpaI aldolase/citrate lyase family protein n=1 Tax=unclassified Pseudoclavibacter TaxID=2615177 RepID=UPI000CE73E7D|nr:MULTISPECIES: CoA ester lyase [unclassified Pseudoclavibacter]PPF80463.1 CoA ester lyase [Pseudoclavibacter sp. RFBJ5]PPF90176.1 CoA ester lyase [Pseudoclavibacter sp. RFBJ3]PPG00509.1 CoA ester lyase [Pseudoclavibacter sp. RFBH5]PPG19251.1 CoA ester lyase [Pseudoclavibacter sp. RFBI4]
MSALAAAQTLLFVPGDRPDRFSKALDSGANLVILDLEDAVAADNRERARTAIRDLLATAAPGRVLVRVNPADTGDSAPDLALLEDVSARSPGALAGVAVPKAESRAYLRQVSDASGGAPLLALVETVRGLRVAETLVTRGPGEPELDVRLAFGALDFAVDAGGDADSLLDAARVELVLVSRLTGAPAPVESPSASIRDLAAVESAATHAVALGFGGMLAIHPAQLPAIASAFRPTDAQIDWARRVVGAGSGAAQVDGAMVDAPVLRRARRLLAALGEAS